MTAQEQTNRARGGEDEEEDVFDCSSVMILSERDTVDRVLDDFVQRWKDLDGRKKVSSSSITAPPAPRQQRPQALEQQGDTTTATTTTATTTTKDDEDDDDGDNDTESPVVVVAATKRVRFHGNVSTKPMAHKRRRQRKSAGWNAVRLRLPEGFDYATRLASPPGSDDNDDDDDYETVVSMDDPGRFLSYERELWKLFREVPTRQELNQEALEGAKCSHMLRMHHTVVEEFSKILQTNQLSRLRVNDRHDLPPPQPIITTTSATTTATTKTTTVWIECWRRQLRKAASPEANRMVLEFQASQSLLQVHQAIVELTDDVLWWNGTNKPETSGFFLIEDTFYTTTGETADYTKPILQWLNGSDDNDDDKSTAIHVARKHYLNLEDELHVKPMENVLLSQLSVRLATRYVHVHHGDVECALFFSDMKHGAQETTTYPIIHDVWKKRYATAFCDGCAQRPATLTTPSTSTLTDGGPRFLCKPCHQSLFGKEDDSAMCLRVWREQADLSPAHCHDTTAPF